MSAPVKAAAPFSWQKEFKHQEKQVQIAKETELFLRTIKVLFNLRSKL